MIRSRIMERHQQDQEGERSSSSSSTTTSTDVLSCFACCFSSLPEHQLRSIKRPDGGAGTSYLMALYRLRWVVVILSFVLAGALIMPALGAFDAFSESGFDDPTGDAYRTEHRVISGGFALADPDVVILMESNMVRVEDEAFKAAYAHLKTNLKALKTFGFVSYFDFPLSQSAMVSDDGYKALVYLKVMEPLTNAQLLDAVPPSLQSDDSPVKVTIGGAMVAGNTMDDLILEDLRKAELGSLPIVLTLMFVTFGGLVASLCPLLVALLTITFTLALLHAFTLHWHVTSYAIEVVTMMGLGLSIDYSLFVVGRFMSERRIRPEPEDIVVVMDRVMGTSGRTIQFSAVTVMISLTGSFVFHEFFIGSLSLAIMCTAFSAFVVCSTFLPALLYCLDHHVFRFSAADFWARLKRAWAGFMGRSLEAAKDEEAAKTNAKQHGLWYHVGHFSMRHPLPILCLALLSFSALTAVFFTQVNFGSVDANVLPVTSPARAVFVAQSTEFSKLGGGGEVNVYLRTKDKGGVLTPTFLKELDAFATNLMELPGVSDVMCQVRHVGSDSYTLQDYIQLYQTPRAPGHQNVTAPLFDPFFITNLDRVSRLGVSLKYGRYSPKSRRTVKHIRELLSTGSPSFKALLDDYGVASDPAYFADLMDDVRRSAPTWALIMVSTIFVLVLLMTASPFLAAKAVITSVLSLGAAFGIIVLIFQTNEGRQNGLGLTPCGYLDGLQMIFIFTIAFGLAVDYELFLLSSIQEWYHRLGDHREAIAEGLDRAGRYVSMAAVLLAVVVGAFVLSSVSLIKMIGFGIAVCVVLDATIVRSCVIPTVLILAGERVVWWSPKPLRALVDRLGLSEKVYDEDDDSHMDHRQQRQVASLRDERIRSLIAAPSAHWMEEGEEHTSSGHKVWSRRDSWRYSLERRWRAHDAEMRTVVILMAVIIAVLVLLMTLLTVVVVVMAYAPKQ